MRISDWSSDVCSSDVEPDNERGSRGFCGSLRERQCAHAVVIARQLHGVAFDDLGEMRDLGAIGLRITIEEEILDRCASCAVPTGRASCREGVYHTVQLLVVAV